MDNWEKIEEIFHRALGESPEHRREFLERACGNDEELLREVSRLLEFSSNSEFLEKPPFPPLSSEPDSPTDLIGRKLGTHRILSLIAKGGMGEIYKAVDERSDRLEALKILPPEFSADRSRVRRFQREAKTAAALSHPGIAQVFEVGEAEGVPFIAMEFVEGQDLSERLEAGPLKLEEIAEIVVQAAHALSAAHKIGIVHRDVKPSNIMITAEGNVKLLDFGLVKAEDRFEGSKMLDLSTDPLTRSGTVLGTVGFLSPEQAMERTTDQRCDIFALGVVLYKMATGHLPFQGTSPADTLDRVCHRQPLPIARFNWAASEWFESIVQKCLKKDPAQRYQSMDELIGDLESISGTRSLSPGRFFDGKMILIIGMLIVLFVVLFALTRLSGRSIQTQESAWADLDTLSAPLTAVH